MRFLMALLIGWLFCTGAPAAEGRRGIWAGAAKVDITPPLPAPFDLLQVANEIAHPLHARVLYLADKDTEVVLVSTEYEGILRTVLNLVAYGDRLTLARNLSDSSKYDLQVLRAGPLCVVFLPGESFIELALQIREESDAPWTFVSAYNDCTPVYVPDASAFAEGGYEVGLWCYSTPQTAEVLVREALKLIAKARR